MALKMQMGYGVWLCYLEADGSVPTYSQASYPTSSLPDWPYTGYPLFRALTGPLRAPVSQIVGPWGARASCS